MFQSANIFNKNDIIKDYMKSVTAYIFFISSYLNRRVLSMNKTKDFMSGVCKNFEKFYFKKFSTVYSVSG